ncbi:MAG: ATP-grasp domain-containing protein [Planctomycetes bacterium]|nr:ATP-grasp domain-containing protein [Planctomycetota bacterium]
MKIGIVCNLKSGVIKSTHSDDFEEEFDSPETMHAIGAVLASKNHQISYFAESPNLPAELIKDRPDFVFNFAEGRGTSRAREARVPALLEILGIPYSGSDPFTLCIGLDKDVAKKVVSDAGVKVPKGAIFTSENFDIDSVPIDFQFPVVVKPAWEGSSKGIRDSAVAKSRQQLRALLIEALKGYEQPVIVEEYLPGVEMTVGLIGNGKELKVVGAMEIVPKIKDEFFIYSLEVKRNYLTRVDYCVPPKISGEVIDSLFNSALKAFKALGCKDFARIDFRLNTDDQPVFIEANPLPGLNPVTSDFGLIAKGMGLTYEKLILSIFEAATKRLGL